MVKRTAKRAFETNVRSEKDELCDKPLNNVRRLKPRSKSCSKERSTVVKSIERSDKNYVSCWPTIRFVSMSICRPSCHIKCDGSNDKQFVSKKQIALNAVQRGVARKQHDDEQREPTFTKSSGCTPAPSTSRLGSCYDSDDSLVSFGSSTFSTFLSYSCSFSWLFCRLFSIACESGSSTYMRSKKFFSDKLLFR